MKDRRKNEFKRKITHQPDVLLLAIIIVVVIIIIGGKGLTPCGRGRQSRYLGFV